MINNKIKAALITIVVQLIIAAIFFVGFLLDPLLGLYIEAFYFFVLGSFLIYKFALSKL